jgi:transcriptional regulator with XRE-family HTH domain
MTTMTRTTPPLRSGKTAGLALRHIRDKLALTQTQLAEQVGVAHDTVQGWESGRRPLGNARAVDVTQLRFMLGVAGATRQQLDALDNAVRADWTLAALTTPCPMHPLAHEVLTRSQATMLTWPLTGVAPAVLANGHASPAIGAGERDSVYVAMREAADRAVGPRAPLLRRQVYYLVAADPGSADWLRDAVATERRRMPKLDRWTPQWAAMRSLVISRSMTGDREPLREFLELGCNTDATLTATLRYWLHWHDLSETTQRSDEFMAAQDLGPGRWDQLLAGLTSNLTQASGYLELSVRAVTALTQRRPDLLDEPALARALGERVTALLDEPGELTARARTELDTINHTIAWRRH